MRLALQDVYTLSNREEAGETLSKLIRWMKLSRLEPAKTMAKTLINHKENILNYFDSKLTNASLEGVNNIIQLAKGKARGFKNIEYFKAIVYLQHGDFDVYAIKSTHTK